MGIFDFLFGNNDDDDISDEDAAFKADVPTKFGTDGANITSEKLRGVDGAFALRDDAPETGEKNTDNRHKN